MLVNVRYCSHCMVESENMHRAFTNSAENGTLFMHIVYSFGHIKDTFCEKDQKRIYGYLKPHMLREVI